MLALANVLSQENSQGLVLYRLIRIEWQSLLPLSADCLCHSRLLLFVWTKMLNSFREPEAAKACDNQEGSTSM